MFTETSSEKKVLGLHKLTGSNRGLYYANEREETVMVENSEGQQEEGKQYVYDVYEIPDARFPDAVKDAIVRQTHPCDAEHKILRKAVAIIARELDIYNREDLAEFKAYNEFVEQF